MTQPGTPTLDQLKVFLAVVDASSFAGAARRLGRSTSVVSYTIANLEAELGVSLFDRETTRKPQLTQAGRSVLAEVRVVAHGIDGLRAKVRSLQQGVEAELRVVLDVMLPPERVSDAIRAFHQKFPTVALHLRTEALGAVMQLVLDRIATVAVCGPPDVAVDGLERIDLGSVQLVPVAAPGHPLAMSASNAPGDGRSHVQLVLTDRSPRTEGPDLGVFGTHTWRVADLGTKHALLLDGIGWGHMPIPLVSQDLKKGRLVRLKLPDVKGGAYRFFGIYRTDTPLGPAAAFLLSRLESQAPG